MKQRFKRLKSLIQEAELLKRELQNRFLFPTEYVGDVVNDYKTGKGIPIKIEGYGNSSFVRTGNKLYEKLLEIQEEIYAMEEILDDINDSQTRSILRLMYRNGLTIDEISTELGISTATIKRKIKIFWENIENSPK